MLTEEGIANLPCAEAMPSAVNRPLAGGRAHTDLRDKRVWNQRDASYSPRRDRIDKRMATCDCRRRA